MSISAKKDEILNVLRCAARGTLCDESTIWQEIEDVMARAAKEQCGWNPKAQIDRCVYALAMIYARHTGCRPAFTNCEAGTTFEHFVASIPMPHQFRITPNRIKASIRRMDPPRNPSFTETRFRRSSPEPLR